MDGIEAIMTRRSIRNYTPEPVSEQHIETILRAAMAAPSAGNQQSWRFVVVTDAARREQLAEATPYSGMVARAPLAFVVCGDTRAEKHSGYWVQDCSAAVENALVAINALGLGAVWIGVHPIVERSDNVRRICGVPDGIVPFGMIAVGHPAETKPPSERYEPAYVHREVWTEQL
jgi:nitroreductase